MVKVVVLYRSNSEHGRKTEEFMHEFSRRYPDIKLEAQSIDAREGSATASFYDIVSYPGILALQGDGSASAIWQGDSLPLIDEVAGYVVH